MGKPYNRVKIGGGCSAMVFPLKEQSNRDILTSARPALNKFHTKMQNNDY